MDTLWQDLRYGFRNLSKNPAFFTVAVLSLALGIGANTAIFTVVKAVFLQPAPFETPERIVTISTVDQQYRNPLTSSYLSMLDVREKANVFSNFALMTPSSMSVTLGGSAPETWSGEIVSGSFFELLGTKPMLGRTFNAAEDVTPGQSPLAVLSFGAWTEKFASDLSIVGKTITVNRMPYTITGVMPLGFKGINTTAEPSVWVPMSMASGILARPEVLRERRMLYFHAIGRLREGVSIEQANSSIQPIAQQLAADFPESHGGRKFVVRPMAESFINPQFREWLEKASTILLSVVSVVLLIACGNVAALLLVRARSRSKEFAVRLAMGASTVRIVRQLLTESLILSFLGGAFGLLLAKWARDLMWRFRPPWIEGVAFNMTIDWTVITFAFLSAMTTGALFGLAPALTARKRDLVKELRERTATLQESRIFGVRSLLVAGQCALSVIALVGAGLFLESLQKLEQVDPGMLTSRLITTRIDLNGLGYNKDRALDFFDKITDDMRTLPGVRSASVSATVPFSNGGFLRVFHRDDEPSGSRGFTLFSTMVGPRYFETAGIPLLEGREFTAADHQTAPKVVMINESAAKRLWPNEHAVGKRLMLQGMTEPHLVVGLVKNNKFLYLNELPRACVYVPLRQEFVPQAALLVQSAGDAQAMLNTVRTEIQRLDRNVPVGPIQTIEELIGRSLWSQKLIAGMLAAFGLLALILASVGVYGLTSYAVTQRTNEIGLRMALGAQRSDVIKSIIGESMRLVIPGILVGLAVAFASSRFASSMLYGVTTSDPPTYLAAAALLALIAVTACYLPARRASKVDPLLALRHE